MTEPAKADSVTGNFETKAQNLAMRLTFARLLVLGKFETLGSKFSQETHRGYWRPLQATKFFSLIFTYGSLKIL